MPDGTAIPAWMFLDIVTPDRFNLSAAQEQASKGLQDITAIVPSSTTLQSTQSTPSPSVGSSVLSTQSTSFGSSSPLSTQAMSASSSLQPTQTGLSSMDDTRKSRTGPIAGAVVGGLVLVGVVAVAVWFYRRRHGIRTQQSDYASGHRSPAEKFIRYDPDNPATFPDLTTSYNGAPEVQVTSQT